MATSSSVAAALNALADESGFTGISEVLDFIADYFTSTYESDSCKLFIGYQCY